MKHEQCNFVNEGQIVWAPYPDPDGYNRKGTAIRCVVVVAAGTKARVKNESRNFCKWFDVMELRREVA